MTAGGERRPLSKFRIGDAVVISLFGADRVCRILGRQREWVIVAYDYGAPPAQGGPQTVRFGLLAETPARALLC